MNVDLLRELYNMINGRRNAVADELAHLDQVLVWIDRRKEESNPQV